MSEHFPFRTERLLLRPVTDTDLASLLAILGDGEVMKLALYERPLASAEAQRFIDDNFAWDASDTTRLGVLCRSYDGAILGFAGLIPCKYFPGDLEFGFVLAAEHQRKGYATEIGKKLIDVGFSELSQSRLLALCDPRNRASMSVLEKLGMWVIGETQAPDRGARIVFEITQSHAAAKES